MINITQLENGFRIASDEMHDVETVTVSLAVGVGSRFETKEQGGISHFLEHMAFKGTAKRTALQIAEELEMVGGYVNAFTSKERTVYYVKVLKNDLRLAIDIISDIIQNSAFDLKEIERERGVILQELASGEDTPDDVVFDYYYETLYKNQPIGRPIIGTRENINSFKREDFQNYIDSKYNAGNMVLAVAGNASHDEVLNLGTEFFNKLAKKEEPKAEPALYNGGEFIKPNKELTQVQFVMGYQSYGLYDDKSYSLKVANNILGGGMSSRLFQEVREKRGLVYTVSSFDNIFNDSGIFGIYAGASPENIKNLQKVVEDELSKMANTDATDEEMIKTINQLKAGLLMSMESTTSRSQRLASNILNYGRYMPNSEIIEKFEKVTKNSVRNSMSEVLSSNKTLVIYGNI